MTWTKLQQLGGAAHMPGPRSSHAMTYANGALYLAGGEQVPRVPVDSSFNVYKYILATSNWSKLLTRGDIPSTRISPTIAGVGQFLYLFGGRTGKDMVRDRHHRSPLLLRWHWHSAIECQCTPLRIYSQSSGHWHWHCC